MTDLTAVSGLTAHERRTLAQMLTTIANKGVASVTNGPSAGAHNRAFVDLLRDLTQAGLLNVRSGASESGTGTLVAAEKMESDLQAIAAAAGAGGDELTVAIASATSPEAVAQRQDAAAERAARIAAIQANRLPDGIPPPPGYNRAMEVVDPALAFPGFHSAPITEPSAAAGAPTASPQVAAAPSAQVWAQAARAFAQSLGPLHVTLAHTLRSSERADSHERDERAA